MDSRVKETLDRAKWLCARSYFVRFRAQSIAGWARVLCRLAGEQRASRHLTSSSIERRNIIKA
jgi:hypothetical protein